MKTGDHVILISSWTDITTEPLTQIKRVGTKYFYVTKPWGNREEIQFEINTGRQINGSSYRALYAGNLRSALSRVESLDKVTGR